MFIIYVGQQYKYIYSVAYKTGLWIAHVKDILPFDMFIYVFVEFESEDIRVARTFKDKQRLSFITINDQRPNMLHHFHMTSKITPPPP